jgi:hypothetical protein
VIFVIRILWRLVLYAEKPATYSWISCLMQINLWENSMGDVLFKLFAGACVVIFLFVWACSSIIEALPD